MAFEFSGVTRVAVGRSWTLEMQRLGRKTGRHVAVISLALTTSCGASIAGIAGRDFDAAARVEPVAVIAPNKLNVNTFVTAANREAQIIGAKQTCFANQLAGHAAEAAIVKSMVVVAVVDADGTVKMFGSAFVIRDSATVGKPLNKMLTAAHVVNNVPTGGAILLANTAGRQLGFGEVTAAQPSGKMSPEWGLEAPEVATLSIQLLTGMEATYRQIPGLELAPVQANRVFAGLFGSTSKGGIEHGHSGGALVDDAGRVHGVLSASLTGPFEREVLASYNAFSFDPASPAASQMHVDLPRHSIGFMSPISDPQILKSLGRAGADVHVGSNAAAFAEGALRMNAVGFPAQVCRVSEGTVGRLAHFLDEPTLAKKVYAIYGDLPTGGAGAPANERAVAAGATAGKRPK
jgi:hypothetical protein